MAEVSNPRPTLRYSAHFMPCGHSDWFQSSQWGLLSLILELWDVGKQILSCLGLAIVKIQGWSCWGPNKLSQNRDFTEEEEGKDRFWLYPLNCGSDTQKISCNTHFFSLSMLGLCFLVLATKGTHLTYTLTPNPGLPHPVHQSGRYFQCGFLRPSSSNLTNML